MHCYPAVLTIEEERRFLASLSGLEGRVASAFFIVALHTGLRAGEITHLLWEDVDFASQTIHVEPQKIGGARDVPMSAAVYQGLKALAEKGGKRKFVFGADPGKTMRKMLKIWHMASKRLGVKLFGLRTLRYTFASRLAAFGVGMRSLCSVMGTSCSLSFTQQQTPLKPITREEWADFIANAFVAQTHETSEKAK